MKYTYHILLFCNLILLSGCNFFESQITSRLKEGRQISYLDSAAYFTKSIIDNSKLEKIKVEKPSLVFTEDYNNNLAFNFDILLEDTIHNYTKTELRKRNIDSDSASVTIGKPLSKITFYTQESNLLFDVNKIIFFTLKENKIHTKNIKLEQRLLNSINQQYEVNYTYFY